MKKICLLLILSCIGLLAYGQTTVTIYAGGGLPVTDSITGYADSAAGTRVKDTIASDALERGYAVFNLSSIPAGSTITSVVIGYNIASYTVVFGTASAWNIKGYAGDLSGVTNPLTLYADCGSGTSLYTGNWGTATGNQTQPTNAAATSFISAHIGSKVAMCFTSGGYVRYTFTGEVGTLTTTGNHAPYLQITYTSSCPAITPHNPTVCPGSTLALTDSIGGGSWTSSVTSVATVDSVTGVVTGISNGTTVIQYITSVCNLFDTVTVSGPSEISPGGGTTLCVGSTRTFTDSVAGGTWSSSNTGIATISSSGVATGVSSGTTVITYSLGGCYKTRVLVVSGPQPIAPVTATVCVGGTTTFTDATTGGTWSVVTGDAAMTGAGIVTGMIAGEDTVKYTFAGCSVWSLVYVISGTSPITPSTGVTVCIGSTTTLADTTTGGTWTSGSTGVATVGATTGVVTGISAGTAIITYSVGSCTATKVITVSAGPAAISPASATVCVGGSVTFTDATSGGAWSTGTTSVATVSGGVVTGTSVGVAIISYTVGGCSVTATVTVNSGPAAITPAGSVSLCTGGVVTLSDATTGGTWTSGSTGVATVSGGAVTGITVGTATISYTISGCTVTKLVTVTSGAAPISPATATLCAGSTVTFSDATSGGAWTSGNTGVATVVGGVVSGVGAGTALISYTVGTCSAIASVTVNAGPVAIAPSGAIAMCSGTTTTLTDATAGGTWTSGNTAVATVSGGVVTAVGAGTATITYTIGSCYVTKLITVTGAISPVTPSSGSVCVGSAITLTDATTGGIWTTGAPTVATVSSGVVTGVAAGAVQISYTVGSCSATASITVNNAPAAIVPSGSLICQGTTETLTDATAGGVWSTSSPVIATVDALGDVTGTGSGVATISYTVAGCSAIASVTVSAAPTAISPVSSGLCLGSSASLIESVPGGTWSSASVAIATVSGSGLMTGTGVGSTTITYAIGSCITTATVTVNPLADPGTITGGTSICGTGSLTLTDATTGGVWSASNGNATVSASGVVTGVTNGTDVISYTVTNGCGSVAAMQTITVVGAASVTPILGPSTICAGSYTLLSDSTAGGVWSTSNGNATFTTGGLLTGLAAGTDTVYYTVTNACGSVAASKIMTVFPLPDTGVISGPVTVCSTITLSETVSGGVWSSVNSHATVSATGLVTGVSAGLDTIRYSVTNSCGTLYTSWPITVNGLPAAGTITGPSAVCAGSVITLVDIAGGGSFSCSNGNATIVPATGVVTGIAPGVDTITYTVFNICGIATTTKLITVDATPAVGAISGLGNICIGSVVTLTDGTPGGAWSASNATASVSASGVVTGNANGTDTIMYTIANSCGAVSATFVVSVTSVVTAGTITGGPAVCAGSQITLSDAVGGGTWSVANGNATISAAGVLSGVTAGTDVVSYTISNSCGTATAVLTVTIESYPTAGIISGGDVVCQGGTLSLSESLSGGTWSSGLTAVATISPVGVITGISAGTDTISYTIVNTCGTVGTFEILTVMPLPDPGTISGPGAVCLGNSITLSDPVVGGIWSSSSAAATVAGGVVTSVSAGTTVISYSLTNSCGTVAATMNVSVDVFPVTGPITGLNVVCEGATTPLGNSATGGTWSVTIGNASVDASGNLTGITAGQDSVYYTITNACGTASSGALITINPTPVVTAIGGNTSLCVGTAILLSNATTGGVWTSGNTSVAIIDAAAGMLTGLSAGIDTIYYSVTNGTGCTGIAAYTDTVLAVPAVSPVLGSLALCQGGSTSLSNAVASGTWSSGNTSVAIVDPVTGVVTAVGTGTAGITYSINNMCGSATDAVQVTVNAIPSVSPITGATTNVCAGATTVVSDVTTSGTWSSSDTTVAVVSGSGVVTGSVAGVVTITYTVNNGGCVNYATYGLTFGGSIGTSSISASSANLCGGGSVTLQVLTASGGLTYQWLRNGSVIIGATGDVYVATVAGSYNAIISNGSCEEELVGPVLNVMTAPVITFTAPNILSTGSYATYQWYRNGILIPGATSSVYHETLAGYYTVEVSDGNGCTATSAQYAVPGGIGSGVATVNAAPSVIIYPNPSNGIIHIEVSGPARINIMSPDGKLVMENLKPGNTDISALAVGLYMVMVYDDADQLVQVSRLVKE